MSLLSPHVAAHSLGVDISADEIADAEASGSDVIWRRIEGAARALAVERFPLALEDCEDGEAPEWEPNDGGTDGCAPAAVRHVVAGALVAALVAGGGYPYGDPPWLPLGAGPIREEATDEYGAIQYEPCPEEATQATRGRYGVAEAVCRAMLGVGGNGWSHTPAALHAATVDLAIALVCDERYHVAEVVAGAAAWLLWSGAPGASREWCGEWVAARARRMIAVVGVRFGEAIRG